jgi:transcriptional regulator GlxA family with amidase domain
VRALVERLRPGRVNIAAVAAALGVSERQLRRRCEEAVGYGPKMLDRVLRLQRFRSLARLTAAPLVELAATAGYADQAHLSREHRQFAGRTPGGARRLMG